MSSISPASMRALSSALERLYTIVDSAKFGEHAVSCLEELLPGTLVFVDELDYATGTLSGMTSVPIATDNLEEYWQRATDNVLRDHYGIAYLKKGGAERVLQLSQFTSQAAFRNTGLYWENYRPFGISYEAAVVETLPDALVGLAFTRDRDFSEEEMQLVRLIEPHFRRAHANAKLMGRLKEGDSKYTEFATAKLIDVRLTPREAEIARWIMHGKRDREIAELIDASPRTVQKHVQRILEKLHVETRSAAVVRILELTH